MNKYTDIQNSASHHELVISGTCKVHAEEPFIFIFSPNQIRTLLVALIAKSVQHNNQD